MAKQQSEEVRRIVALLERVIKLSGRSQRSIETETGLGTSVLGKLLHGIINPKLEQILLVCDAIGLPPGDFFEMAFPKKGARSQLAEEALVAEGITLEPDIPDDLDERVRAALGRMFGELQGKL